MKIFYVKENHIGSAVSWILHYTHKQIDILLLCQWAIENNEKPYILLSCALLNSELKDYFSNSGDDSYAGDLVDDSTSLGSIQA